MPQPGHAPPQQMGYRPPPGQQQYGGGPPPQRYGYPPPQQQGYGVPPPQKQGYASPVGQQPSYCSMQQTDGLPGKAAFGPSQGSICINKTDWRSAIKPHQDNFTAIQACCPCTSDLIGVRSDIQ